MSARVLCNEISDLLVAAHGPGALDMLLHPPTVEEIRVERTIGVLALGGEVA